VKGSELARARGKIDDTLKGMSLEVERVQTYEVRSPHSARPGAHQPDETVQKIGSAAQVLGVSA
jgi:hypothetical protein